MRLIGLRHGQSEYNLLGLCNDDPARRVDLTPLGRQQAEQAAQQLAGEPIEQAFCSPLLRASLTAQVVSGLLGCPLWEHSALADIRSGCDGRPVRAYLDAIAHDPVHARVADGESLADYDHRVGGFIAWLQRQPWRCVVAVAHEETLRIFAARAGALDLRDVAGRPFANCTPYVFDFDNGN